MPTRQITTPIERLIRMRKSFEKEKSVLTIDYKYFITPDAHAAMPRAPIPRKKVAHKSAGRSEPKSPKQS